MNKDFTGWLYVTHGKVICPDCMAAAKTREILAREEKVEEKAKASEIPEQKPEVKKQEARREAFEF